MKRLRCRHTVYKNVISAKTFICHHVSLFILIGFVLIGIIAGISVFRLLNDDHRSLVGGYLYKPMQEINWTNSATTVIASCFKHSILLVLLFLFGLTAFGCPLILCTVIAFGFRVGIIISTAYAAYGFWHTSLTVYLPLLLVGIATLLAVRRSLHMSCVFSSQLLPSGAHCGGLWCEFKRYLVSYVISSGILVAASVTEVLLQILKSTI